MVARMLDLWPVEKIRAESRYRRDLGDLAGLMESIKSQGLINPITVDENGRLLAGGRRLAAVKQLGFTDVQVHIIETLGDVLKELQVEEAENLHRKELTLSERVRQGEAIRQVLADRARQRQRAHGGTAPGRPGNTSHGAVGSVEEGRASRLNREASAQTARALGMGGTNYRSIRAIQTVADDPTIPERRRELAHEALRDIDAGGSVQRITDEFRAGTYGDGAAPTVPTAAPVPLTAEAMAMHHRTRVRRIRVQNERFDGLATQAVGMKMGIDGLLRDELPLIAPDMAKVAQWVSDLQSARRSISDLVKRLKEITA